jgi:antitoxin component YwqK of YwqJK toxin-antitoxin module
MTAFIDYKSPEKDILINILNEYSIKGVYLLDSLNISSMIENMIYEEVEEYYDNGTLECKYTLRFGEKDGLCQRWYENGQKSVECHYRDDKKNGLYQEWFVNGQKSVEDHYRDDKLYGLYQEWKENGQKEIEYTYIDGKRDGEEV